MKKYYKKFKINNKNSWINKKNNKNKKVTRTNKNNKIKNQIRLIKIKIKKEQTIKTQKIN